MEERLDLWAPVCAFLKMHSSYFEIFKEAINFMFYGDGPLPVHYRHYLAIMAACRHQCQYLINLHKEEFLRFMGKEEWLDGRMYAAQKIKDIDYINRILAHRPWLLQASHLQKLSPPPNGWSLSELMQGAVILSHTHALCSFIHGCGISSPPASPSSSPPDKLSPLNNHVIGNGGDSSSSSSTSSLRHVNGRRLSPPASLSCSGDAPKKIAKSKSFNHVTEDNVEKLMACMQQLNKYHAEARYQDNLQQFIDINVQSSEIALVGMDANGSTACLQECTLYTDDCRFSYTDFFKRSDATAAPTFKIHDYSWDDQGYSVFSELYSQLCNVVDDKFKLIQDLTYHTMGGHKNVDTTKYRTAVWNYIQSLYGIRHDDYDYSEVNKLLSRQMKTYIKTLCCYPERTKDALRESVMVHVNLMIFEARFQAELLYLLRAVLRFIA